MGTWSQGFFLNRNTHMSWRKHVKFSEQKKRESVFVYVCRFISFLLFYFILFWSLFMFAQRNRRIPLFVCLFICLLFLINFFSFSRWNNDTCCWDGAFFSSTFKWAYILFFKYFNMCLCSLQWNSFIRINQRFFFFINILKERDTLFW